MDFAIYFKLINAETFINFYENNDLCNRDCGTSYKLVNVEKFPVYKRVERKLVSKHSISQSLPIFEEKECLVMELKATLIPK